MAEPLAELHAKLTLDTEEFDAAIERAEMRLEAFAARLREIIDLKEQLGD